ncbi:MuF-C-terminal domain-containing protein [Dysgonomonas termitidis]|uniref:LPD38 domain-containing protein n=1 Tax=Dysgonomonas termitidis TaxID=1516126 RepID=A0ABV9L2H6_9BACT
MPDFNVYINNEGAYKKVPSGREREFMSKYPGSRQTTQEEISEYDKNRYAAGMAGASAAISANSTPRQSNIQKQTDTPVEKTPVQQPDDNVPQDYAGIMGGAIGGATAQGIQFAQPEQKSDPFAGFSPEQRFNLEYDIYNQRKDWLRSTQDNPDYTPEQKQAMKDYFNTNYRVSDSSIEDKDLPLAARRWLKSNMVERQIPMYNPSIMGGGMYHRTVNENTPEQSELIRDFIANTKFGQDIAKQEKDYIQSLENSIKENELKLKELEEKNTPSWQEIFGNKMLGGATQSSGQGVTDEQITLSTVRRQINEQKNLMKAIKEGDTSILNQIFGETVRGGGEMGMDITTLGAFQAANSMNDWFAVNQLQKRIESGTVTDEDRLLMSAMSNNQAYQDIMGDRQTTAQKATSSVMGSMPFMAGFAITGGLAGSITQGAKSAAQTGIKNIAANTVRQGTKAATARIGAQLTNAGLNVADAVGRSSIIAAINPHTYRDMFDNMTGQVTYGYDANGKPYYLGNAEQMGFTNALLNAFTSNTIENVSEFSGGAINQGTSALKRLLSGNAVEAGTKIAGSPFKQLVTDFMQKSGWNGIPSEFTEEQIATILHSFFEDGQAKWSDLTDPNQQFITFLTTLSIGSGAGLVSFGGDKIMKYGARRSYDKSVTNYYSHFPELSGKEVSDMSIPLTTLTMSNVPIINKQQALHDILNNNSYSAAQKTAAINMYKASLTYDAYQGAKQGRIDQSKQTVSDMVRDNSTTSGRVITIRTKLYPEEINLTGDSNIVLNEDGTVNIQETPDILYYSDPSDGKRKPISKNDILEVLSDESSEDLIKEAGNIVQQQIDIQDANDETREYQQGETVRANVNNIPLFGEIAGMDQSGNYLLSVETPQGIQQIAIQPSQIIDEDNIQGVDNGSLVEYRNERGETVQGTVNDAYGLRSQGMIDIDGNVVPVENIIGLTNQGAVSSQQAQQKTDNLQPEISNNEGYTLAKQSNVSETGAVTATSIADNIINGDTQWNAEEIQFQQNYPQEIENILKERSAQSEPDLNAVIANAPKQKNGEIDYDALLEQSPADFATLYENEEGPEETHKELISVSDNIAKKIQSEQKKLDSADSINKKKASRKAISEWQIRKEAIDNVIRERYEVKSNNTENESEGSVSDEQLEKGQQTGSGTDVQAGEDTRSGGTDRSVQQSVIDIDTSEQPAGASSTNGTAGESVEDVLHDVGSKELGQNEVSFDEAIDKIFAGDAEGLKRKHFNVALTPEFMKGLGITGDKFTMSYGVISRHINKDADHTLTPEIWKQLPEAIKNPFAITRKTDKKDGYRLYTTIDTDNGFVVVGVDVKKAGRDIDVNAISTVFNKEKGISGNEEVLYESEMITPQQKSVLANPNYPQYTSDEGLSDSPVMDTENRISETAVNSPNSTGLSSGNKDSKVSDTPKTIEDKIAQAEAETDTNPTEAQKEAGNYKKGHVTIQGFDISIEQPKGSVRSGVDATGKKWSVTMNNTYGYIRGTEGKDSDHIDVFLGGNPESNKVFVIDQVTQDSSFDEHKVMLGFDSIDEAREAYLSNYEKGWQGLGNITEVDVETFRKWAESDTKRIKPFAEYKEIQNQPTVNSEQSTVNEQPETQEGSSPYGASNTLISSEQYEELRKRMRDKLNNLNMGFDPELFTIGTQMAMYHIEAGARKFADFANRMIEDLGDNVRPYLKSFYESARYAPGMETLSKEMDSFDIVNSFDVENLDTPTNTNDGKTGIPAMTEELLLPELQKEAKRRGIDIGSTIDESNIRMQFIGEQGAANLDQYEEATTRLDNLNIARDMETAEKDTKAIKLATGWERGADGKWRYEIPDSHTTQAFKDLDTSESIPLEEALVDKALFEAYPKLKDVKVKIVDTRLEAGSWNSSTKTIELSAYIPAYKDGKMQSGELFDINAIDEGFRNVLLHEIQHAIQDIEGFAEGGNTSTFKDDYPEILRSIEFITNTKFKGGRTIDLFNQLSETSNGDRSLAPINFYGKKLDSLAQKYGYADRWQLFDDMDNTSSFIKYRKLGGEVEARNVQSRMNMTQEERLNTLASETEDVSRKDQIFIRDGIEGGIKAMQASNTLESVNNTFNQQLQQQIDGTLPKGHTYSLGNPSSILQSAGIPDLPIEMASARLLHKSNQENHPFDLSEVKDLPRAIHNPLAVFRSATHIGSNVILTELKQGGKNFVAVIETNSNRGKLEVNSIRSIHPRTTNNIANWINEGLMDYGNKEKLYEWLGEKIKSRSYLNSSNPADVKKLLDSATNIVQNFENTSAREYISQSPFKTITAKKFNDLIKKLKKTGLAKNVIVDKVKMREYLDNLAGKEGAERFMRLWHGSPHSFKAFSTSFMGTGEGVQAFGWGLYFTERKDIAKWYAETLKPEKYVENATINQLAKEALESANGDVDEALKYLRKILQEDWSDKKRVRKEIKILETGKLLPEGKTNLYEVNVDDDLNFIRWDKPLSDEQMNIIDRQLEKEFNTTFPRDFSKNLTGESVYYGLDTRIFKSKADTSKFLLRAGFDGIQYPAQSTFRPSDGEKGFNYVVFDDAIVEIVDKIRFMSTPQGDIYGFVTKDGGVYLDPDKMNANTPVHEFGHLWNSFIKANNPELWARGKELIKESRYFNEVFTDPAYRHLLKGTSAGQVSLSVENNDSINKPTDEAIDRIADEALARFIGNKGESVWKEQQDLSLYARVKAYLNDVWNSIKKAFGFSFSVNVEDMTLEDFTDKAVKELLGGKNIVDSKKSDNFEKTNSTGNVRYNEKQILAADSEASGENEKGRGRNAQVAARLGSYRQADRRNVQRPQSGKSEQEKSLKEYAEQEGIWMDEKEIASNAAKKMPSGKEADVYLNKDGKTVTKVVNYSKYSDTPADFLNNRILLFNQLFKDTPYKIVGFTENDKGFSFVVEQPYIKGKSLNSQVTSIKSLTDQQKRVENYMKDNFGMNPSGLDAFSNGEVTIEDIHLKNVMEGEDGNLYIIDAIPSEVRRDARGQIVSEMEQIKQSSVNDGTFMLAPNGKPTNLDERQWLQVRTANFKNWFGDWENDPEEASKMLDNNGEPKIFYHRSPNIFTEFDATRNGQNTDAGWLGDGFYFYGDESESYGYGDNSIEAFLNIREPYYATNEENLELSEKNDRDVSIEFSDNLKSEGYDGVYFNGDFREETVVFDPNQIKSATENTGDFSSESEDIRFQAVEDIAEDLNSGISKEDAKRLDKKLRRDFNKFREAYFDRWLPTKIFLDTLRKAGTRIDDIDDYHMRVSSTGSKIKAQYDAFDKTYMKPLSVKIAEIEKKRFSLRDIENYAILKFGSLERNPLKRREAIDTYKEQHPKATEKQIADFESRLPNDYSGVAAVEEEVGTSAEAFISEFENKAGDKLINEFWETKKKSTDYILKTLYESGRISKEEYDRLKQQRYYIPLRGHDQTVAEDIYDYSPSMGTYMSDPVKRANGRVSRSESPFAYINQMGSSAIKFANWNDLNKSWYRIAGKDKTGLITRDKTWYMQTGVNADGEPVYQATEPEYSEDPEVYANNIKSFNKRMYELSKEGKAHQGKFDLGLFTTPIQKEQHTIPVYVNGTEYSVYINANPAVSRAIKGINTIEHKRKTNTKQYGRVLKFLHKTADAAEKAQNWRARNVTSRNPNFIVTNFERDYLFSSTILGVKEGAKYALEFQGNIPGSFMALQRFIRGKMDMSNKYDRHLSDFILQGGETGYMQALELDKIQGNIEKDIKREIRGYPNLLELMKYVPDSIDAINKIAENLSRFSVYVTSIENGRSVYRAISDAKNVTVNFNQTGSGQMGNDFLRRYYMFVNPALQAAYNLAGVAVKNKARMTAAVAVFGSLSYLASLLAYAIGGDDGLEEYYNLSDWDRQNHLCIYTGSGFIKYSLPHELRVFTRMGDNFMMACEGRQDALTAAGNSILGLVDLFPVNPLGSDVGNIEDIGAKSLVKLTPDRIRPFFELAINQDFAGNRIYNQYANENAPGHKQALTNKKGEYKTPEWMVDLSKAINDITGGDNVEQGHIDYNPDKVYHVFNAYLGGQFTFASRLADTADRAADPEKEVKVRNTPLRSFYISEADIEENNSYLNNKYYNISKKIEAADYKYKQYEKEYPDSFDGIIKDKPEIEEYSYLKDYVNDIKNEEKLLKELKGPELKEQEQYIKELKEELIKEFEEINIDRR